MAAAQALSQAWTHRGWLAWLLWPISLLYGLTVALRRWLYAVGIFKTHRVAVPVIVVGNVVAGGAGKTPIVMAIVKHLQARGWQVGVVSRGYGRHINDAAQDCREVLPDSPVAQVGDEPALIRQACEAPVFVASKRAEAATALLHKYPQTQVIVSDDGLQHHALHRDIEICVFDDRGIGNGFLLPAGPLREPWPRVVDLLLHSGQTPAFSGGFSAQRALANYALRSDGSRLALAVLRGKPLAAVAAIAQPEQFFSMLRDQGLTLAFTEALPDHYTFNSWIRLSDEALSLVCTEKDAVKLWRTHPEALAVPLLALLPPAFAATLEDALKKPAVPGARLP